MATAFKTILIGSGGPRAKEGVVIETPSGVAFDDIAAANTSNHLFYIDASAERFGKINLSTYIADKLTYSLPSSSSSGHVIVTPSDDVYLLGRHTVGGEEAVMVKKYDNAMDGTTSFQWGRSIEESSNAAAATLTSHMYDAQQSYLHVLYNPETVSGRATRMYNSTGSSAQHDITTFGGRLSKSVFRQIAGGAYRSIAVSMFRSGSDYKFRSWIYSSSGSNVGDFEGTISVGITPTGDDFADNAVDTVFPDSGTNTRHFAVGLFKGSTNYIVLLKLPADGGATGSVAKRLDWTTFSTVAYDTAYPPVLKVIGSKVYIMAAGEGPTGQRSNIIAKINPDDFTADWVYRIDQSTSGTHPYHVGNSERPIGISLCEDGRIAFATQTLCYVVSEAGLPTGTYGSITVAEDGYTATDLTVTGVSYSPTYGSITGYSSNNAFTGDTNTEGTETFTTEEIS